MKILYDHQIFESHKIGGISRYFTELLKYNSESRLSIRYSDNVYLNDDYFRFLNLLSSNYEFDSFLPHIKFRGKGRLVKLISKSVKKDNKSFSIDILNKSDFDIFHPTYYDPYFLKYLNGKPFVLTVHDMIHEIFSKNASLDETILNKRKLILAANMINVNSENTKRDLLSFYPDIQEKTTVIHHAFSFPIITNKEKSGNYILFTGNRDSYKNFIVLIQALAPILIKYNINLICTGHPFTVTESVLLKKLMIFDKVIHKFANENELYTLYSNAILFVFPSLYEGFGIPVLEAFATCCPALLSNTSSLPEIGGDAAEYFDPYSIDDMRTKIEAVLCSPARQKELSLRGLDRAKLFSLDKMCEKTMDVYKKII